MADDTGDIARYYNSNPDSEHCRLDRHQLEHDLTWRYLEKYLPPSGRILEVGAATGRYTGELARRGYRVTAVDLSAELIQRARVQLAGEGLDSRVRFLVSDARDLAAVNDENFDAVLLMGPLYHLVEEADRELALREAADRLRSGGVIFSAFLSRFGVLGDLIKETPQWIQDETHVTSLLQNGKRPPDDLHEGFRGYFASPSEIAPLHERMGFQTVALAGVEPAISADDESYNELKGEQRRVWLNLLFRVGTEQSTLGASRHLLYVGKKSKEPVDVRHGRDAALGQSTISVIVPGGILEIRLAHEGDADILAALRWDFRAEDDGEQPAVSYDAFVTRYSAFFLGGLRSRQRVHFVAIEGGNLVGHLVCQLVPLVPRPCRLVDACGVITDNYVSPPSRNHGVGGALLHAAIDWARKQKLETIIVWPSERARSFYVRHGFAERSEIMELILRSTVAES